MGLSVRLRRVIVPGLAVVLLVSLLAGGEADETALATESRVFHPVVSDGSGYLNNGYAEGAHLLTLPGNLLGLSSDGTIAATRSTGGQVKGYRLADGQVAWELTGDQVAALGCQALDQEDGSIWYGIEGEDGVLPCVRENASEPFAVLNLRTGQWIDLGWVRAQPTYSYGGVDDRFIYATAGDPAGDQTRFVSLDFDGREAASVSLFDPAGGALFERSWTRCRPSGTMIRCVQREGEFWIFDATTGELKEQFAVPNGALLTSDGFWLARELYTKAGEQVGSLESWYCLTPNAGVEYPNADHLAAPSCSFTLVGPSGRVFAEHHWEDAFCVLTQAGKRVPVLEDREPPFFSLPDPKGFISSDEKVIAILPTSTISRSDNGARLFDPYTGELIDRFPLPWAQTQSGIIYWTTDSWEPDNLLGTQVLVPGG